MTRRIPIVRDGLLHEEASPNTIVVESDAWYGWLERHDSFRFEYPTSTFTARKEQRAGSWYWYAYRRQAERLRTAYLGKDGKRDFQKGMITSLAVTGSATTGQSATPIASAQITMRSFSYSGIPANVAAGAVIWQVTNVGTEPYEFYVVKLAPGKTAQDIIAFYAHPSGPPPFISVGGMSSISPELSGWVKFNLAIGNYVAFSQVFDKVTGKSQFLLGMLTSFTVQ